MGELTITIPFDLACFAVWQRKLVVKYETNQVIKAIDTWLVLKSVTQSSLIKRWNKQKKDLIAWSKCSETIFRHRIRILQDMKLLKSGRDLRVCSWEALSRIIGIDVDKKFSIQYNINDKKRLQEWLIATEIKDNQNRQAYSVIKKVNNNPEVKQRLAAAAIQSGADKEKLKDHNYFLSWMKILYQQDFVRASDIHDLLIEYRPDTNRGVKKMADAWNCKHPMTVSYWKKVLQKSGIIDVSKLQIQSEARARNKYVKVLWLKQPKQTLMCFCDQVLILQPWQIDLKTIQTIKTLPIDRVTTYVD